MERLVGWLGCYGWLVAVLAIKCTLVRVPLESFFSPLFIETMGAMGPKSMALLREVGRRVAAEQGSHVLLTTCFIGSQ